MNRRLRLASLSLIFGFSVFGFSLLAGLTGCAGSGGGNGGSKSSSAPLTINTTSLPAATFNQSYTQPLTASGGTGSGQIWSLASGTLPTGVTLSSSGTVSGTPTVVGTFSPKIQVTDSGSNTASTTFSLVVYYPTLSIVNTSLPAGIIGSSYTVTLNSTGGSGTGYTWSLAGGTLPTGVTLSSSGTISGTPTVAGTFSPKIQVTDSASNTASTTFSLVVSYPTLSIVNTSLPAGTVGSSYSATLNSSGGSGTGYTYSVISGTALSAVGLNLSSAGVISGTPTTVETSASVTVQVMDSAANTASTTLALTVYASLAITTTALSAGTQGTPYSVTFAATGGAGGNTWALATGSGPLPTGITLSSAGVLSGTPTQAGSFPISIQVKDSANNTKSAPYTLIIYSACVHDGSGNSVLKGNYAFQLAGYDPTGSAYDIIGDFTADGAGNISNGNADANGISFAASNKLEQNYTFTGTYSIGSSDNRGMASWTNSSNSATGLPATSSYCFAADSVTAGVAYSGRIIEADGSGFMLTGYFQIQNPSNFNNAALSSGYAFGVQGFTPGGTPPSRNAIIGQIALNGSGGVTSGTVDVSSYNGSIQGAQYSAQVPVLTGSSNYSIASNGRGTLTVATGAGNITFIVYVVGTGNKLMLLSNTASSSAPLLSGQAMQQTQSSFSASSLNGGAVYREIRTTAPSTPPVDDDVRVGQYSFNGSGGVNETRDENAGGVITLASTATGTYTVSSSGYLSVTGINNHPPNFYLYAPNAGYGLDASSGIGFYTMLAQSTPSGGFTSSALTGAFSLGSIFPTAYNASSSYPSILSGAAVFSSGGSTVILTGDQVVSPGLAANISANQTLSDTYALGTGSLAATGRFLISQAGLPTIVGYAVSSTQAFMIAIVSGQDSLSLEAVHQ